MRTSAEPYGQVRTPERCRTPEFLPRNGASKSRLRDAPRCADLGEYSSRRVSSFCAGVMRAFQRHFGDTRWASPARVMGVRSL